MRKRSGTLEIGFRSGGRPEDYEGEYQCFASNEFGVALSNKILLRVSSKNTHERTHAHTHYYTIYFIIGYKEISFNQRYGVFILEKMKIVKYQNELSLVLVAI